MPPVVAATPILVCPLLIFRSASLHGRPATNSVLRKTVGVSARDTAQRGIEAATAELQRRGASVEPTQEGRSSNHLAVRATGGRPSVVYVITRTTKAWQTDVRKGTPRAPDEDESRFWLLVDFAASPTDFYIVPESWMENDINRAHEAFLAEHGGTRPLNPKSTHHGIGTERVAKWRDRWDLLGL